MSKRFKKQDWLTFGLHALATRGPEALRVKVLCATANKTIGSFYHHFADQAAFMDALISHWRQTHTQPIIDALDAIASAEDRAQSLTDLATRLDPAVENGVRLLASQNDTVSRPVQEVDEQRIAYVAKMYGTRFNIPEDEALSLARLEYAAFVGAQQVFKKEYSRIGPELGALFRSTILAKFVD